MSLSVLLVLSACSSQQGGADSGKPGGTAQVSPTDNSAAKVETRELGSFRKISASGNPRLQITVGKATEVKVETNEKSMAAVQTEVVDDTLTISLKKGANPAEWNVAILMPELTQMDFTGAVKADLKDMSGDSLRVVLSGANSVSAAGKVKELFAALKGSSHFNAVELQADKLTATTEGGSRAVLFASQSANLTAAGASVIDIHGSPKAYHSKIEGDQGQIVRRGAAKTATSK